jgi:hypothetical protein
MKNSSKVYKEGNILLRNSLNLLKEGNILLQYSLDEPVKDDAQRLLACCSSKRYQELPVEKELSVRRTIIGPHVKKIIL